jgi:hypothetical protein
MFIEINTAPRDTNPDRVMLINIHHILRVDPRQESECAMLMTDGKSYIANNSYSEIKRKIQSAMMSQASHG